MKPSSSILGASRLPLTPKRANKDFYKGTGQSRVPGGGHRTGPPGKHVVQGKGKYRLIDERVRYFVGPPSDANTAELKPYVSVQAPRPQPLNLPSFSPNLSRPANGYTVPAFTKFSKQYQRLRPIEKEAMKIEARRNWWNGMVSEFGSTAGSDGASEEATTRAIEQRTASSS